MKALAVLRVSTTSQQIDDQRDELYSYAKRIGYDEIVPVEAIGASAIKMDEKYMEMAQKVKDTILSGGIDAVFVWEISRLGRNEVILMDFKEFFIKHRIQFYCINPSLKLLNDDGSVNGGTELAFSLFATMSKQEMIEKKERFKRRKKAMAKSGMYIGGNTRKYGYYVNENGFFEEKPEESCIIKSIFELYSTGKYSVYTLSKELEERGIHVSDGAICKILKCDAYTGKEVAGELGMRYPPIIDNDLFEKVREIRKSNRIDMKRGRKLVMGSKIVKCHKCGATCTSNSKHYVCCRHSHHGDCDNGFALRQCVADNLMWRVASIIHVDYLTNLNTDKAKEYRQQIIVLDMKISAIDEKVEKSEVKRSRIIETYMEGLIDKNTRDIRLSKVKDEVDEQLKSKASLQTKRDAISTLIDGINKDLDYINSVADFSVMEYSEDERYDIIHKHIISLTAYQQSFGRRDPRTKKPNGILITINTAVGEPWKFMYVPKLLDGHNLYSWSGKEWVADDVNIEMV